MVVDSTYFLASTNILKIMGKKHIKGAGAEGEAEMELV